MTTFFQVAAAKRVPKSPIPEETHYLRFFTSLDDALRVSSQLPVDDYVTLTQFDVVHDTADQVAAILNREGYASNIVKLDPKTGALVKDDPLAGW